MKSRGDMSTGRQEWLPDETLFSYCARRHRLSDHRRQSDVCVELFGRPRRDAAHNLPSQVASFVGNSAGSLGTAEEIVRQRTIVAFYLPFLPEPKAIMALHAALHHSVQRLRLSLCIPRSTFSWSPPLKACLRCLAIDHDQFGVAYWHLAHQFPAASYCLEHEVRLGLWTPRLACTSARDWPLPLRETIECSGATEAAWDREFQLKVTALSLALGKVDAGVRFEPEVLGAAYLQALRRKGLVHERSYALRRRAIGPEFSQYLLRLSSSADFHELPKDAVSAATHVARVVRATQPIHPLWHIPLIAWLFANWQEFSEAYASARDS